MEVSWYWSSAGLRARNPRAVVFDFDIGPQ